MMWEKIQKINSLRKQKDLIVKEEYENTRPVETELEKIPSFYERFAQIANPSNRDNTKMFIYIVFFMYSPASCIGRGVRGGVRRSIARLLQVSNAAISQKFGDAKVLFVKHKGFRSETERIYNILRSE